MDIEDEFNIDLSEMDLDDLNAPGFDLEGLAEDDFTANLFEDTSAFETLVRIPKAQKILNPKCVKYSNALKMAEEIWPLAPGESVHGIIDGRFLFGDLIEAALVSQDVKCREMWIMTLTLTGGNIESLVNILDGGYCDRMHLIVSDYWMAHERGHDGLLSYVVDELGTRPEFQMSTCRTHAKIVLLDTIETGKQVIHGSANLRASGTADQICVERNDAVHDFYREWFRALEREFWVLNKAVDIEHAKAMAKRQQWQILESGEQQTIVDRGQRSQEHREQQEQHEDGALSNDMGRRQSDG